MKTKSLLALGIATLAFTQPAAAEVTRLHKSNTDVPVFVECLNDTIVLNYEADIVISEVATYDQTGVEKTWKFNRNIRQYGEAVDSQGNMWKFRGQFNIVEQVRDGDWWDNVNFHLVSRDIFVSQKDGLGVNLSFVTQWHIRKVDGIYQIDVREDSASCMGNPKAG